MTITALKQKAAAAKATEAGGVKAKKPQGESNPSSPPDKKRKPLKLASPKSSKSNGEKTADTKFHNRLETFGVNTGDCGFRLLCPRSDIKEAYIGGENGIHDGLVQIMDDDVQSNRHCLQAHYPLRDPSNPDQPLDNGRPSSSGENGHWKVYLYSHDNPAINTAEWRSKWGRNFVKVINAIEQQSNYQYKNGFIYSGDTTPDETEAYLGDYLTTEDLLVMLRNTHGNDDFAANMVDPEFARSYFGEKWAPHATRTAVTLFGIQLPNQAEQQPDQFINLDLEVL